MFLRFLLVFCLVGALTKGQTTNTTTVENGTSGGSTTPYMTGTSSNGSLVSTLPVIITTPQVSTTVTPVSSVNPTTNSTAALTVISTVSTNTSSTNPPSAPTTATATAETNQPTSETTATTTTPTTTQNIITSPPVTTATTLTTQDTITNATSTSISSATTTGSTITSDLVTTNASVTPTNGSANTSPQVTSTDSTTTVNPPPSINTTTAPVTYTDNPSTAGTVVTPIIITTPGSMQTSATTTATSAVASNSTITSETSASAATPPSSVTTTTGHPSSSPSSISTSTVLPPITSPGSSTTPLTGNTTSFIPTTSPGVTINTENITIPYSTTASPSNTTLMSNVTTVAVTALQPTNTTTVIFSTAAPPTYSPVTVCPSVPCPAQSVCLNGTCQCLSGSYMQNKHCVPAQVFPGRLLLKLLTFKNEMSNRSSSIFQITATQISAALRDVLKNVPGYKRSDVVQLQPGSVIATVNNIFEGTSATQGSVDLIIKQAVSNSTGFLSNSSYTGTNLCEMEPLPCDVSTTLCTNTNGQSVCSCKKGYISIIYSNNSCKACPSGQWAVGDSCQSCSFGYAGFNCDDSALLAVVVVSCVLGGILLILIVALLYYCCWRRGLGRHPLYTTSPYSDDLNKTWPIGITPIPRAINNWDAAASIEMTETDASKIVEEKKPQTNGLGSQLKPTGWKKTGSYDLNPDEMQTFKGKYTSRYSYLVQGHENPYFLPGDEKKD